MSFTTEKDAQGFVWIIQDFVLMSRVTNYCHTLHVKWVRRYKGFFNSVTHVASHPNAELITSSMYNVTTIICDVRSLVSRKCICRHIKLTLYF
ncbi:hypothetical protein Plhal304r1_c016g0059971 [Plasmopara halstedii]